MACFDIDGLFQLTRFLNRSMQQRHEGMRASSGQYFRSKGILKFSNLRCSPYLFCAIFSGSSVNSSWFHGRLTTLSVGAAILTFSLRRFGLNMTVPSKRQPFLLTPFCLFSLHQLSKLYYWTNFPNLTSFSRSNSTYNNSTYTTRPPKHNNEVHLLHPSPPPHHSRPPGSQVRLCKMHALTHLQHHPNLQQYPESPRIV